MIKQTSGASGRALTRLLRALARAHAFAEVEYEASELKRVRVLGGEQSAPDVIHHANVDVWQKACRAGLVEQAAGAAKWKISLAGRQRLSEARAGSLLPNPESNRSQAHAAGRCASSLKRDGRQVSGSDRPGEMAAESPLSWLYRRRDKSGMPLISEIQFEAGERLRRDYECGQLMPRLTVDWDRAARGESRTPRGSVQAMEIGERALAARQRVSRAMVDVGPELASLLVDVCCHLKGLEQLEKASGWPQRSAKIVLLLGLSALARHYGLDATAYGSGNRDGPAHVLHWGVDGYRPKTIIVSEEHDTA